MQVRSGLFIRTMGQKFSFSFRTAPKLEYFGLAHVLQIYSIQKYFQRLL